MPDTDQKCVLDCSNTKSLWRGISSDMRTIWCCKGPISVGSDASPQQIALAEEAEDEIECCVCLARGCYLIASPCYIAVIGGAGTLCTLTVDACKSLDKSGFFNCCHGGQLGYSSPKRQQLLDSEKDDSAAASANNTNNVKK
ncbi:MAG: hypothetical protein M1561_07220 [Gammaproteobacteria bacterium]|nr:hypothetical protein [Gammaproteobacteria bacterium]